MREFVNTTLLEPLTTIGTRILHFLPNLFAAVIILGVGWLLARLLGRGVERLLRMLGIDHLADQLGIRDRKSTRLNSSHGYNSYAVFCLKKKNRIPPKSLSRPHPQLERSRPNP